MLRFRRLLSACLLIILSSFAPHALAQLPLTEAVRPAGAASKDAAKSEKSEPALDVDAKRIEVARRLSLAQKTLDSATAASSENGSQAPEKLSREVELLKQRELVLDQIKTAEGQLHELQGNEAELIGKLEALRSGGEAAPASFLKIDQLRDELAAEEARKEGFDATIVTATQVVDRTKAIVAEKERARLQAKEALETNKDAAAAGALAEALKLAEQDRELAGEIVRLREIELAKEQQAKEIYDLRITHLKEQIKLAGPDVRFTKQELEERLDELRKLEDDLNQMVAASERMLNNLDKQWLAEQAVLELSPKNQGALTERLEALQLERQTKQQEITKLKQRLERRGKMRVAWQRRYEVISGEPSTEDLIAWETETKQILEQLQQESRLQAIRVDELRGKMSGVEAKLQAAKDNPEVLRQIELQRKHLQELSLIQDANYVSIDASRRLHEKLLGEIRQDVESASLSQRLAIYWQYMTSVWNYVLTSVDDRPITVGKIISGFILLIIGYLASRFLSRMFGRRVLPRVGMHESAATAMQSIVFYVLVATFTLLALKLVNVPLTVFTFLGGALAIGVGFGSQNIVNNFISGLILLAERPIRTGDLVQLDTLIGTVAKIGARSTRVTTATNLEIIVPNSKFLEGNVINWTLSDDRIRTSVNIGVSYGSPTREVSRLLRRAADEHGLILPSPEPMVWFTEFGDNALQFELHFWLKMRTLSERRRIESDIRHKIDSLFREARIVIAFPQRDVHMDIAGPLDVRLIHSNDHDNESAQSKEAA
jgi:potassium efflux system protein